MPTDLPPRSAPAGDPGEPAGQARSQERMIRPAGTLELDPDGGGDLSANETSRLIAAAKVEGAAVYDEAGAHLGAIRSVMIDKVSGQVGYVVLASGGLLGLGETYHPLPWNALRYAVELGGYVVTIAPSPPEPAPVPGAAAA